MAGRPLKCEGFYFDGFSLPTAAPMSGTICEAESVADPETPSAAPATLSVTPATPPDTLSVTPATPPDSVSVTPVRPSTAPVADSVTPCAAVAAASPTAPRSIGKPGISIPSDSVTPATAFFNAAHIRISSRSKTMVPPQLTTDDICRHDRESRVVRASGNRVTSLIAPPGSRCCGRVVNTCVALQTGGATARLRRYAVRHGARASVRCESCHRFSSLFGQPNLSLSLIHISEP